MKLIFSLFLAYFLLNIQSGIAQVSPQTGAAQASIPLYTYSDPGNRLSLNASLDYVDGNGLKVSEMASCVGTGWVLNCGGVISRIQHGAPDDQFQSGTFDYVHQYFNYSVNYYPNGYLYSEFSPSDVIDNAAGHTTYSQYLPSGFTGQKYFKLPPVYAADREQDEFAFTFNGRTGRFVIGKNWQVLPLNDSKIKVDIQTTDMSASGVRTRISQFTITDESGIQYIFKDRELDYVCTYNDVRTVTKNANITTASSFYTPFDYGNCVNCGDNNLNVVMGKPGTQFVVNKWYLSQIYNPLTQKQITFNYTQYEEDVDCDKTVNYTPSDDGHGSVSLYWQKYKAKALRLSNVILSNMERVDLTYSTSPRIDLIHDNTLDKLQVSYNGAPTYAWNFAYGYFEGFGGYIKAPGDTYTDQEKLYARLCLLNLQKTGQNNVSDRPYQFAYNMGGDNNAPMDAIPPMFSLYQDHYGYYNAGKFAYAYPESSPTSFYDPANLKLYVKNPGNTYKLPLNTVAKNGTIKTITYPFGGSITYTYEANTTAQAQIGGVRVATTMQFDGIDHGNDIVKQYKYINADGSPSGWGGETFTYLQVIPGTAYKCSSGTTPAFALQEMAFNYLTKGFLYHDFGLAAAGFSSGLTGGLVSMGVMIIVAIVADLFSSDHSDFTANVYNSTSMVNGNPLPFGYARVEVVNLLSTDNVGKTVYEFSSPADHAIEVPTVSVPNSNRPRYAFWVYGLTKTVTVFDKSTKMVQQTINNYNYIVNPYSNNNFLSRSWTPGKITYLCTMPPVTPISTASDEIIQEPYYPLTGRVVLTATQEIKYNTQQQSSAVTTNYEYDNNYQLHHQFGNNSKGEKIEKFYYHPYDYPAAVGAIGVMNGPIGTAGNTNFTIYSPVLSTETYINKSDGNKYLIEGVSTDYDYASNGDIKPKVSYAFQNALPLQGSVLQTFNTSAVLRDPAYFKQLASYGYDNYGNLVQTVTGGNRVTSTIYDYDGKLVVATAMNASYSDIGYISFEGQGGKAGSWLNGTAIINTDARTGSNAFNLSDPSNAAVGYFGFGGLNSSLTYIVSFWSKNGAPCVNGSKAGQSTLSSCQGSVGWKQGTTVNGWTYYELQVSNADKIGMSGTGLVDEFRVYPAGALMTTSTYAPLIGKTSECDAANRVRYYTYDELGRLVKVSDDQRNVIKTYEYNYKQ